MVDYNEDPYQHIIRIRIDLAWRPFIKVRFAGTASENLITFSGVGLSGGGQGNDAWGIVPLGGSVGINVPTPTEIPFDTQEAVVSLNAYDDITPGALEAAIAIAVGGGGDVPGAGYGSGFLFSNQAGYIGGDLSSINTYSGLVYSLDELGRLVTEVNFPDGLHETYVTYNPPLSPFGF